MRNSDSETSWLAGSTCPRPGTSRGPPAAARTRRNAPGAPRGGRCDAGRSDAVRVRAAAAVPASPPRGARGAECLLHVRLLEPASRRRRWLISTLTSRRPGRRRRGDRARCGCARLPGSRSVVPPEPDSAPSARFDSVTSRTMLNTRSCSTRDETRLEVFGLGRRELILDRYRPAGQAGSFEPLHQHVGRSRGERRPGPSCRGIRRAARTGGAASRAW